MVNNTIDKFINSDLHLLLTKKNINGQINIDKIIELSAYTAAKYLRVIFMKNKEIKQQDINGVIGIISNFLHDNFGDNITSSDYNHIASIALELLNDIEFDSKCDIYFK